MQGEWIYEIDGSWTLFLDRDGVLNRRIIDDYVTDIEEFHILDGVLEALYLSNDVFYKIIVVTNQQGIAKDIMTHEDLRAIHDHFINIVTNAHGRIDQIYYSPDAAFSSSLSRTPNIGMGLNAKADFRDIDFSHAVMVGDSQSDIDFGNNLGMKTVFVSNAYNIGDGYDLKVDSLLQFIKMVINAQQYK